MISSRLQMRDINPEHWARLTDLLLPPPSAPKSNSKVGGGGPLSLLARATAPTPRSSTALSPEMPAIVLHRKGVIVRIFRLGGGALSPEGLMVTQEGLRAFRRRNALPFVAAVDIEALPELWADAQSAVRFEDEYVVQQMAMLKVFRKALGKSVLVDPRLFGSVPLPSARMLQRTFDRMLPDGRSFVFYLTKDGALYTSVIAAKRDGDIHLVTTHDAIAHRVPSFGAIRPDAKRVLAAVKDCIAPPHIGVFLPLSVWHQTVAGDRSAIARALAGRRALLDPAPPWVLALVGVGAVAEAATRGGRLAGQLLAGSKLGARLFGNKVEKLAETLSNPLEALGLDPWELLRWGRDWRRRVQLDRSKLNTGER